MNMYKQKSDRDLELINNLNKLETEDKELLMNLAFISALMEKDIQTKRGEIQKLIRLSKNLNTNLASRLQISGIETKGFDSDGNETYDLEELVNLDIIKNINPKDILNMVVEFASNIGFFDNLIELERLLESYKTDLQIASYPDANVMDYRASDNSYQYLTSYMTPGETYANLAYLFNKLAHIFEKAQKSSFSKFLIERSTVDFKQVFMRAKDYSIHRVIEEKKNGEDIKLGLFKDETVYTDNKYSEYVYMALPHYLQPILLHVPKGEISEDEKQICTDKNDFSYDYFSSSENSAVFPLKLTPEKEEALKFLYEKEYKNRVGNHPSHVRKLRWLVEDNTPKPIIKSRKSVESSRNNRRLSSKKKSITDIYSENKKFLQGISSDIGVDLPEYLEEKFLHRASYSFEKFYEKIKTVLKRNNEGVSPEELEDLAKKVFIDMKITKPVSTLTLKGSNSTELINEINDSAQTCLDTVSFIQEEANNFSDYAEFKNKLKEASKAKEERDDKSKIRLEIDKLLEKLKSTDSQIMDIAEILASLVNEKKQLEVSLANLKAQLEPNEKEGEKGNDEK